jgi:hypothetical protein
MKIEMKSTVDITPELLAAVFCGMDDDQQCKFFVEVGRIAAESESNFDQQWYYLGGHLRNCECSTEHARRFIRGLYDAMQTSTHA